MSESAHPDSGPRRPFSRRAFTTALGGSLVALGLGQGMAQATSSAGRKPAAAQAAAADDPYTQAFLTQYNKMKDPSNGYFSPDGIPYHCVETLIVEAPDHGHQTTSEAFSYWMWLEAAYGRVTGDWSPFNNSWAVAEKSIIPQHADQPSNDSYNASSPATYAPEHPLPSGYPSTLDSGVPVGSDPIAAELKSAYGTSDVYGMHWLMDLDNVYGYGNHPGTGGEAGPGNGASFINSYQRGAQESVWETVPQPTTDLFNYGGDNGYLDLFTDDTAYSKQWKYTDAPDADSRAVQAAYWAYRWADAQGKASQVSASVAKAAKMGDYLRYAMFDKYFKKIGDCTSPTGCAAGSGRSSQHYLLSWYYAWGGAEPGGGWAWRIGDSASHQGYQNPLAAWALANVSALKPKSSTGASDWSTSLTRQLEFLRWLQSSEGGLAGGATNSWNGAYEAPPSGTPTFYGMAYDWQPVYHDPPSNSWFGFQVWGMQRVAEYYYVSGNASAKAILDKWVAWAVGETTVGSDGSFAVPSTLTWSGQPDTWNASSPGNNSGLHVSVKDYTTDVGVTAGYVKTLVYYAAKTGDDEVAAVAKGLLDALAQHTDAKGIAIPETRSDYNRFNDEVYIPDGWSGTMPNGDVVEPGVTFLGLRSWYRDDPDWSKVQAYLDGGAAPTFTYHRFWAQADIALAFAAYAELLTGEGGGPSDDTQAPTVPSGLKVTATTGSSVSLSWSASSDDTGVAGYDVYRGGMLVGTASTTSYTDQGLSASTKYTYAVAARDAAGNTSALSSEVSATTASGGGSTGALKVRYKNNDSAPSDNQIRPGLQLSNTGSGPVDLSTVTVRYWFSSTTGASFSTYCDYAALGSSNITHRVVAASGSRTGADHYLEVGFASGAGSLAAGANTGDVQLRLNKTDWSNLDESDDYSYGTGTSYADATKITAYVNGTLAWGQEP